MRVVTPTNRNDVGHVRHRRTTETILDRAGAVATTTLPPTRRRATTATWRLRVKPLPGGDTIAAENFYQHAEHFLRLLKEPTL